MLMLYTIIILALGAAAEQLLHDESPVAMLGAALIVLLLTVALWRIKARVKRDGRWQMDFGLLRVTLQSRVPPAPPQAYRRSARGMRGRSCSR